MAKKHVEAETAVAKKAEAAVARYDYGDEQGAGFESAKDSLSIPFITILQALSPQCGADGMKAAKPGMLFNTVTSELIDGDDGIVFLPVYHDHWYVEWVPRGTGGGIVTRHPVDSPLVEAAKKREGRRIGRLFVADAPKGAKENPSNELVETQYVYGIILDDAGSEALGFAVIAFTSTKIKPFRNWLTSMFTLRGRPPLYANRARIKSVPQKGPKGSFFNYRIEPLRETWIDSLVHPQDEHDLFEKAKEFRENVVSGVARPVYERQTEGSEETEEVF